MERGQHLPFLLILIFTVLFMGCAANRASLQQSELGQDYGAAIAQLEAQIEENPDDIKSLRQLGLVYYKDLQFDQAIAIFQRVLEQEPDDGVALFYTGTAYEINGNIDKAISFYQQYNRVNSNSPLRGDLENRLHKLLRAKMLQEVKTALAVEDQLDTTVVKENSLAVVYFKYMGNDSLMLPLQKGLADMIITDLSKAQKLTVVERLKVQSLFEEMGLGTTGLVDAGTAPRVGNLLGTANVVNGAFIDLADDQFRIDAGITGTRSGEFNSRNVSGKVQALFDMEKQLVFGLIDDMGIELTQEEIDNIRIVPTENLLAFMAYCKAIDYRDRGIYRQADQEIQNALDIDPSFDMAREFQTEITSFAEPLTPVDTFVENVETEHADEGFGTSSEIQVTMESAGNESTETSASETVTNDISTSPAEAMITTSPGVLEPPTILDRLQGTQQIIDIGFVPGVESREPVQEQNQQTFGSTANIEIKVDLPNNFGDPHE